MQSLFFIEVTDTFGGEANYSWATRHAIRAKSERGAIQRFSRMSGINWRKTAGYGDMSRFDSKSGATCLFLSEFDAQAHGQYRLSTDERGAV